MKISKISLFAFMLLTCCIIGYSDPDARFSGGSFDGWDCYAMSSPSGLGGALVAFSSVDDQIFDFTDTPALSALTILAEDPQDKIDNGTIMRISVPAEWGCCFDPSKEVTFSGNAAGKVGTPSYYEDNGTLFIPVISKFVANDTLIVSGLYLAELRLVGPDAKQLEFGFYGDGEKDVYDVYALTISGMWPGGSFDGWDRDVMAQAASL